MGNVEYSTSNDQGDYQIDVDKIYNAEGYVQNSLTPVYYYLRKDHLGNNREVWNATNNTTVQRTQYYASGLPWNEGIGASIQRKKYNGKEFVEMHGYDSYVFGHRDFYPAINRFTTIDWKAEDTYDVSPYSYAGNNPVRFRDENGDGLWDVVVGAADAITDAATMGITNQSERASYDDADDYNTGQTIGNITSIILGGLETIGGGGTAAAGGALAVAGSETLLLIPVGVGVAAKGSAMMAHGTMMMAKGAGNLAKGHKNLVEDAKKSQGKKEVTSDRQAKREAQTEKGKSKIGNSNQGTRGSHGSMKGGNKGDKHSNAEARRASEQKKADEKRRR